MIFNYFPPPYMMEGTTKRTPVWSKYTDRTVHEHTQTHTNMHGTIHTEETNKRH